MFQTIIKTIFVLGLYGIVAGIFYHTYNFISENTWVSLPLMIVGFILIFPITILFIKIVTQPARRRMVKEFYGVDDDCVADALLEILKKDSQIDPNVAVKMAKSSI